MNAQNNLLSLALMLLVGSSLPAVELFISPLGNDSNPGTKALPMASLTGARDAIRGLRSQGQLPGPVHVIVADGDYVVSKAFELMPVDSGTLDSPVIYEAAVGARPRFIGGRKIGGWQPAPNGLFTTQIPNVAQGQWYFEQLFVNGRRATRARTPNKGYFDVQKVQEQRLEGESPAGTPLAEQTVQMLPGDFQTIASLGTRELQDTQFVLYHKWDITRRFVDRLDANQSTLITHGERMQPWNIWDSKSRYQFENYLGALDSPGEWFLARDGTLYYWPLPGEDMAEATVIAPACERFLSIQGDSATGEYVEHVAIRGLTFHYARWLTPPGGFEAAQAAWTIEAVVMLDGARKVTIEDCEFSHFGTYGVWFRKGCRDCTLRHCHFEDFGAGGVRIGETVVRETLAEQTGEIAIDNNIVHHGGRIFPCAVGIWIGHSGDNTITHNEIADLYYTGISVGWRWGYEESIAKRNIIAMNHVHHIGQGVLSDMGGIYTLGPSEGTVVKNNVFHDIYAHSYGGWGLYTDEGSTGILFENNLVYNVKTGGFHQHYGKENIIRNNILAYSRLYQVQATRVEEHRSFTFERNIVLYNEGVLLSGPWDQVRCVTRNNCFWNEVDETVKFLDVSLAEWQAAGHEEGSIVANPKFADPENFDFQLAPNSPALKVGFVPFDWRQAGVYGDPEWVEKANDLDINGK